MFDINQKPQHVVRAYRIFPKVEGMTIGAVMVVAMSITSYFIYQSAVRSVEEEIREGLLRNASAVATTIDGERHKTFTSMTQKNSPEYLSAIAPLEKARQASHHVRYIYTNIMKDGQVYFVMNPSPQNDNDGDGKADEAPQLMAAYPDASASLKKALTDGVATVDEQPYTDQWGTFISAYAPFFDQQGAVVGALGMDLEMADFDSRVKPVKDATVRAAMTAIVLAILGGVSVWFARRFAKQLTISRMRMKRDTDEAVQSAVSAEQRFGALLEAFAGHMQEPVGRRAVHYARLVSGQAPCLPSDFKTQELTTGLPATVTLAPDLPSVLHGDKDRLVETIHDLFAFVSRTARDDSWSIAIGMSLEGLHDVELRVRFLRGKKAVVIPRDEIEQGLTARIQPKEYELYLRAASGIRAVSLMGGRLLDADAFYVRLAKSKGETTVRTAA